MDVRLRHGDRLLTIRMLPGEATVDGTPHRVVELRTAPPAAAPGGATVQARALEIDGRVVDVVTVRRGGAVAVALGGRTYVFESGEESRSAARSGSSGTVVAPMPGKVLKVLVATGDAVDAGQPLVVLEAMKMETTLTSEIAGSVHAVHAVAGSTVDAGALLVEVRVAD